MRKLLITLSAVCALGLLAAQEIKFRDVSFAEAKKMAAEEDKPIFMDCYTTWCGPCKWMAANMFTLPEVAEFYNENFVCVSFDMEKGEGKEIAKNYSVKAYPTLLYLDAEGSLLQIQRGAPQVGQAYIDKGNMALNEEQTIPYMTAHREAHFDEPAFMENYFLTLNDAGQLEEGLFGRYMEQFSVKEWTEEKNTNIILNLLREHEHPVYQQLAQNYEELTPRLQKHLEDVVYYALLRQLYRVRKDSSALPAYQKEKERLLTEVVPGPSERLRFRLEAREAKMNRDWEAFAEACQGAVKTYYWDNARELNSHAWTFYEEIENEQHLKRALSWAQRAVELDPNHSYLDTYARLLHATGQAQEALQWERKALKKAQAAGQDGEDYQAFIKEVEASL